MKLFGYRIIDLINPLKWKAFLIGWFLEKYISFNYCEQVIYRSLVCPECHIKGECPHCGCHIPEKFMTPSETCEKDLWPEMMDEEAWKQYKADYKFTLLINRF